MKPPSVSLDVFHICVFDAKTRCETAYAWVSLPFGIAFTFSMLNSDYMPVYTLRRYHGVHFDRPPIPPWSGKDFENGCDDFTGCYGIFLDHFTSHAYLAFFIIFASISVGLVQRYLDSHFSLPDDQESLKLTPETYVLPHVFERCGGLTPAPTHRVGNMYVFLPGKLIHLQNKLTTVFEMVNGVFAPESRRESVPLATAQAPKEFSVFMINVK